MSLPATSAATTTSSLRIPESGREAGAGADNEIPLQTRSQTPPPQFLHAISSTPEALCPEELELRDSTIERLRSQFQAIADRLLPKNFANPADRKDLIDLSERIVEDFIPEELRSRIVRTDPLGKLALLSTILQELANNVPGTTIYLGNSIELMKEGFDQLLELTKKAVSIQKRNAASLFADRFVGKLEAMLSNVGVRLQTTNSQPV